MKKNAKKLRLNRDTLALLDSRTVIAGAIDTSCTYPCDCSPGCSAEERCLNNAVDHF